jgi:hypothetical protein
VRVGDLTVRGNVYPKEIEDGRGTWPDDLIGHFRRSSARYKVPRKVYPEEVLPKAAVGKVAHRCCGSGWGLTARTARSSGTPLRTYFS